MIVFIRIVLFFCLFLITLEIVGLIWDIDPLNDTLRYFEDLRNDHHLKQVFQNNKKRYKSSYRYFENRTYELAYGGIRNPYRSKKKYLITSSCLARWLKGVASSQETICKHLQFVTFCEDLKMEFKQMKKGFCADEYRINYAKQCIKIIDLLLDVLKEQEEKVDFDEEKTAYGESDDVIRHKHRSYYIENPNKNDFSVANKKIFDRISNIDEKIEQCKHYSDTSKQQWNNTIKPMLLKISSKEELNKENKERIMGILNKVSESIQKSESDYKDMQTAATIESVQAFMEMNGW